MNNLHVVIAGKTKFLNLKLVFGIDGFIQSEEVYYTETIEDVPNNLIYQGNMLDAWQASDKTLQAAKEIFYHNVKEGVLRIYLKPLVLKRIANHKIIGGDYSIFTSDLGVVVNYKPGGFKDFKMLHEALNWITEEHYPAQQVKQLSKIISSIS